MKPKRKPIVAANWKMYKTTEESANFAQGFSWEASLSEAVEVVICPPFTSMQTVGEALQGKKGIKWGAQNLYPAEEGAFTGEISPLMLKDLGCTYVILGHSERRQLLGETDAFINKKVHATFTYDLLPIFCVGETLEQRKGEQTEEVCRNQILRGLEGIKSEDIARMVIAYEPIWAIGTGINASPEDAEKTIAFLREVISQEWGEEAGATVRIQYGGSVKPGNIKDLMSCANIDGALVGGASLKVDSFYEIVRAAGEEAKKDGV